MTCLPITVTLDHREDIWCEAFCYADQKTDSHRAAAYARAYTDDAMGKDLNNLEAHDEAFAAWSAAN